MSDIIERAEAIIYDPLAVFPRGMAFDLLRALKTSNAENERLRAENELLSRTSHSMRHQ